MTGFQKLIEPKLVSSLLGQIFDTAAEHAVSGTTPIASKASASSTETVVAPVITKLYQKMWIRKEAPCQQKFHLLCLRGCLGKLIAPLFLILYPITDAIASGATHRIVNVSEVSTQSPQFEKTVSLTWLCARKPKQLDSITLTATTRVIRIQVLAAPVIKITPIGVKIPQTVEAKLISTDACGINRGKSAVFSLSIPGDYIADRQTTHRHRYDISSLQNIIVRSTYYAIVYCDHYSLSLLSITDYAF